MQGPLTTNVKIFATALRQLPPCHIRGNVMIRTLVVALAVTAIVAAPAHAGCWKADQVAAAKVRDLETMLMVSALRCRAHGNMLARYNKFVVQARPALTHVNNTLRAHFAESVGQGRALNAYDSYVTRIANRYGAGTEGLNCKDLSSITDAAVSERPSFQALAALADRAGVQPLLDGGQCNIVVARR
jgi:hypothetical protein